MPQAASNLNLTLFILELWPTPTLEVSGMHKGGDEGVCLWHTRAEMFASYFCDCVSVSSFCPSKPLKQVVVQSFTSVNEKSPWRLPV